MRQHRLRGAQAFAAAIKYNVKNPFAQSTRWTRRGNFINVLLDPSDMPPKWRGQLKKPDHIRLKEEKKTVSFQNLLPSRNMDGHGSGKDEGVKETPVDDVMNVSRGPPDYTFATLPFMYDQVSDDTNWAGQWTFRMTSPYDCSVSSSYTDQNAGTGTARTATPFADGVAESQEKARWFDFYASMYKYYHVVSCRWRVTFENMSGEDLWVHQMYSNATNPPETASNQDMLLWRDCKSHYVPSGWKSITSQGEKEDVDMKDNVKNEQTGGTLGASTNQNFETGNIVSSTGPRGPILQFSGQYAPGDFDREIRTDSLVENWTAVTTNPALPERMFFRVRPQWEALGTNDAFDYQRNIKYRFRVELEYLTEFKELKDGLKWPINQQPISFTIKYTAVEE